MFYLASNLIYTIGIKLRKSNQQFATTCKCIASVFDDSWFDGIMCHVMESTLGMIIRIRTISRHSLKVIKLGYYIFYRLTTHFLCDVAF